MRRMQSWAGAAIGLLLLGCAVPEASMPSATAQPFSFPDGGSYLLTLTRGESLTLPVESNPTTGYGWQVACDAPEVVAVAGDFVAAGEMPGAPGCHNFQLTGLQSGHATLTFEYVRPWETGVAPVQSFRLYLVVVEK